MLLVTTCVIRVLDEQKLNRSCFYLVSISSPNTCTFLSDPWHVLCTIDKAEFMLIVAKEKHER